MPFIKLPSVSETMIDAGLKSIGMESIVSQDRDEIKNIYNAMYQVFLKEQNDRDMTQDEIFETAINLVAEANKAEVLLIIQPHKIIPYHPQPAYRNGNVFVRPLRSEEKEITKEQ